MGRTYDAPQINQKSKKTSQNESLCPDRDSDPHCEGLSGYKSKIVTSRPQAPPITVVTQIPQIQCTGNTTDISQVHYPTIY